ncbi:aromatic acid exporter family protein [Micromonospora orduensis]|uniref:Aromatic acid exporter family protein n=1 Tax=Micromonospora orduensis TaxID=1420891 RepID=A0A5C4QY56_9ACTN|nr:FUSC family protein [Micromonospora orduensis]TNH30965.1 aromatic acid exporter family protein [Micromonospora orduensis]
MRTTAGAAGGRGATDDLRTRVAAAGRESVDRGRIYLIVALQAGLAAALAWVVAREVLGNPEPTFAPAAAVAVIAASLGSRAPRALELIAGVVLGIIAGDLLIGAFGTGPWQTGVIVFLATATAVLVRGVGALMAQAGGTAVLIATLTPTAPDLELPRTLNALVGGAAGLLVMLLLLPINPIRTIRRTAEPALDLFAREMTASAEALAGADSARAKEVLERMRGADQKLQQLGEVATAAEEVVRLSPVRWRRRRVIAAYRGGTTHMERAFRNSRGLVRRIVTTLRDEEPVPADLPAAVEHLGEAVRLLNREFIAAREPVQARERALHAVREAGSAYRQGLGFSGTIVVSQLRTAANDLLQATGVSRDEARRLVRKAAAG